MSREYTRFTYPPDSHTCCNFFVAPERPLPPCPSENLSPTHGTHNVMYKEHITQLDKKNMGLILPRIHALGVSMANQSVTDETVSTTVTVRTLSVQTLVHCNIAGNS